MEQDCQQLAGRLCEINCSDGRRLCDQVTNFALLVSSFELVDQERKVAQQERKDAEFIATHDSLTGLLNREGLFQAVKELQKSETPIGLFFIDITNFKYINDTFGHSEGDEALKVVADTLPVELTKILPEISSIAEASEDDITVAESLTEATRPGDIVARLGGDEFVVVCKFNQRRAGKMESKDILSAITGRFDKVLAKKLRERYGQKVCAAVGGIVWDPSTGIERALKNADKLMNGAKADQHDDPSIGAHRP